MERYVLFASIVLGTLAATNSFASEAKYNCTIKDVYTLGDDASLQKSGFQPQFEGSEFSVVKETGEINGQTLTTKLANSTKVINPGSSENSYKSIAEFNGQFQIIEIQVFKQGKLKPFIASSMGGAGIVTGVCN